MSGARSSKMRDVPAPLPMTLTISSGSSPALMPSTMASALATLWMATSRLARNFILLPLPNADVMGQAREAGEDRGAALAGGAVARGIDDEVARHRLRAGAAQGAIEHGDADFGEGVPRQLLRFDRQRAKFRHDEVPARLGENGGDGLVEGGDAGQAGEDHFGGVGDLGGGARRRAAHGAELVAPLGGEIEADHGRTD